MGTSTRPRDREMDNLVADLCNGEVPLFITGAGYALACACLWLAEMPVYSSLMQAVPNTSSYTQRDFFGLLSISLVS